MASPSSPKLAQAPYHGAAVTPDRPRPAHTGAADRSNCEALIAVQRPYILCAFPPLLTAAQPMQCYDRASEAPIMEPSSRSASAGSYRRSVTCVKQLLRHRLRPPPPVPTAKPKPPPCPGNLMPGDSAAGPSPPNSCNPRMRSPQDSLRHLRRDRYRDTPIYFEPGSPLLWDSCPADPDRVTIINDYEEVESVDSRSLASVNCSESLDSPCSVETCATSVGSRNSRLSLQCQGRGELDNKSALLEWKTSKWCSSVSCEYIGNDEETESNAEDNEDEGDDDDDDDDDDNDLPSGFAYGLNGWGTPIPLNESFDACATALSPAKAHLVDVKSPHPSSLPPSTPHRQTFGGFHSRTGSESETPRPNSNNDPSRSRISQSRSPDTNRGTLSGSFASHLRSAQHGQASTEVVDQRTDLVEAISSFVDSFPENMLTLDAPCIVELRRPKKNSCEISTAQRPAQSPHPNRRTSFGPQTDLTSLGDSFSNTCPSPDGSRPPCIVHAADARAADLSPLRTIFPETNDWWRGLLYAHLVAYNHITDFQVPTLSNKPSANIPSSSEKWQKTPRYSIYGPPPVPLDPEQREATTAAQSLVDVEDSLAFSIICITNFMAGYGDSLYGDSSEAPSSVTRSKPDRILIRSLAEVVRKCEDHPPPHSPS